MNKRKCIKWVCLLTWMLVIFLFSHQPHSGQATHSILEKIIPVLKEKEYTETINFIIRKIAHLTEYFILAFFMNSLLKEYKITSTKRHIYTILLCLLYACTDEVHQLFVIGRTGNWKDCIVDTIGSTLYILIKKINNKNNKNNT